MADWQYVPWCGQIIEELLCYHTLIYIVVLQYIHMVSINTCIRCVEIDIRVGFNDLSSLPITSAHMYIIKPSSCYTTARYYQHFRNQLDVGQSLPHNRYRHTNLAPKLVPLRLVANNKQDGFGVFG